MKIKLENLAPGRVLEVDGPRVEVLMQDDGQAIVTMTLTIGDGTHFHYPVAGGGATAESTLLAAGDHTAHIRISALAMPRFGRTYDSAVTVAGVPIARASGSIADSKEEDSDFKFFVLRVRAPG